MIDLSFINIAISLIFIYLLVALMISGIIEAIFNFNRYKAKKLEFGIDHLFYDKEWKELVKEVKKSPFISSLKRKSNEFPSHIPSDNFVRALLDVLTEGNPTNEKIKEITKEKYGDCGRFINQLLILGKGELNDLEKSMENYFENAKERISAWYTRKAKLWSFFISMIVCFLFNLDSVQITISLYKNPGDAENIALMASDIMDSTSLRKSSIVVGTDSVFTYALTRKSAPSVDTSMTAEEKIKPDELLLKLKGLPVPVGWTEAGFPQGDWRQILIQILQKIFGIAISAAAISMGAPFWYDLLKKISPLQKSKTLK